MQDKKSNRHDSTNDEPLSETEFIELATDFKDKLEKLIHSDSTVSKATLWDNRHLLTELFGLADEVLNTSNDQRAQDGPKRESRR